MRTLITTDLHLTSAVLDAYRWDLFAWLRKVIEQERIGALFILGDLSDAKDKHPASLVNRLVREIQGLADMLEEGGVHILMGNHDYLDHDQPFWGFLGALPRVLYYKVPTSFQWEGRTYLFLPHCPHPEQDWRSLGRLFEQSDYVFMHATARGVEVSNGYRMEDGIDPNYFSDYGCRVLSGDIHVPQGPCDSNGRGSKSPRKPGILYVGSPYRIRFGDRYDPRICILDSGDDSIVPIPSEITIWKAEVTIDEAADLYEESLEKGDQIKVVLSDVWMRYGGLEQEKQSIRKVCKELGVKLCSVRLGSVRKEPLGDRSDAHKSEGDILFEYAEHADLALDVIEAGLELLP